VIAGGATTTDTIEVYADHMATEQIDAGTEIVAQFFRDQGKFVIVEAACPA
jgi:hypothetical protein